MRHFLVSLVASLVIIALAGMYVRAHPDMLGSPTAATQESTYDRVMRTGEIRCGYSLWVPLFMIDQKTGDKSGISFDLMEEAGKRLGLKIVWQEELGWGMVVEAVKTHRVDMACMHYWLNAARLKNVASSAPQIYTPLYAWVRADETRSFASLDDLNTPDLTVTSVDGGADSQIIAERFAKTRRFSMSEMTSSAEQIEAVATKKADFAFMDEMTAHAYIANNPGKIRNLFPDQPVVVFPTVQLLPPDDPRFKQMIDDIFRNIEYDGTLDAILKKYNMQDNFLRNPKPVKPTP